MLKSFVDRAMAADVVALDTEFITGRTYYPRLALIQVGLNVGDVRIIDPLAIENLQVLGKLLEHPGIVKVVHAPETDLYLLHKTTGVIPRNVFDAQHALGFTCPQWPPLSLRNLIKELLGVTLKKSETRSDWMSRPLTSKQCSYAADDVRYLCQAYRKLQKRIAALGRTTWVAEDMARYHDASWYAEPDANKAYLLFKRANTLGGLQRAALQNIAAWRQKTAMQKNLPLQWILSDKAAFAIARHMPRTIEHFRNLSVDIPRSSRTALFHTLQAARDLPIQDRPPRPNVPKVYFSQRALTKRWHLATTTISKRALEAGMPHKLIASKRDIRALVNGHDSALLHGWRYEFVGKDLEALLSRR